MNWKLPVGFAGFAFVLSLLTGAISGVAFGEILLRCMLWSSLFAIMGVGIAALISRFFPELTEGLVGGSPVRKESEGGDEVDITLPDEVPQHYSDEDDNYSFDDLSSADEEYTGEIGSEFGEEAVAGEMDKSMNKASRRRDENLEALEEIDDPFIEVDDIDSLPDLEKFSGSFSNFDDFESPNLGGDASFKPKDNVDIAGVKQDPAKVAKAIHTWIERDKEG